MVPLRVIEVCGVRRELCSKDNCPLLAGIPGVDCAIDRSGGAALRRLGIGLKSGVGARQQDLPWFFPTLRRQSHSASRARDLICHRGDDATVALQFALQLGE